MRDKLYGYGKVGFEYIIKFSKILILGFVILVFMVAIFRIDDASKSERDEEYYSQLLGEIKVVQFDSETIDQIRELEDQRASITSSFPLNRNNPF